MCGRNIAEMQNRRYTSGMSEALGFYLKTMREGYKIRPSQALAQFSERLGKKIDWSRLSRTEKGEFTQWPNGDFLTALRAGSQHARCAEAGDAAPGAREGFCEQAIRCCGDTAGACGHRVRSAVHYGGISKGGRCFARSRRLGVPHHLSHIGHGFQRLADIPKCRRRH
jgi:hypothetical protein